MNLVNFQSIGKLGNRVRPILGDFLSALFWQNFGQKWKQIASGELIADKNDAIFACGRLFFQTNIKIFKTNN